MSDVHQPDVHQRAAQGARRKAAHDAHRRAAEQHELAAHAHRTASEHNEKGDDEGGRWHAERALEYSDQAYKIAKEAQNKSGQMETT
jgi:hypothetical protein